MDGSILCGYIEKIYGFSVNRTFSREEADELSQEILFTVLKELPRLRDPDKFEAWLWGTAKNITSSFRRNKGKQRAMFSYGSLENVSVNDSYSIEDDEIYESLRRQISMLSKIYREIIILYYYENLSIRQISERLNIPEGTVSWRLSCGREKLKKECMNMTETALKPIKLEISINGDGDYNGTSVPFPDAYINDALSQNILYNCYLNPKNPEEIAKTCGVPAFYIEERIDNLLYREALIKCGNGKFRTSFIIYDQRVSELQRKSEALFEPVIGSFFDSLKSLTAATLESGIHTAKKNTNELLYLFGLLALETLSKQYNPVEFMQKPIRYDGNRWCYHAHLITDGQNSTTGFGREENMNCGVNNGYKHISYHFKGFQYRKMMYANELNVCNEILSGIEITDKETAAMACKHGFIKKEQDKEIILVPVLTSAQKILFDKNAEKYFSQSIIEYSDRVAKFIGKYKKLFPEHLEEDVTRACNYMFVTLFATTLCPAAQKKGIIAPPSDKSICDVLIEK